MTACNALSGNRKIPLVCLVFRAFRRAAFVAIAEGELFRLLSGDLAERRLDSSVAALWASDARVAARFEEKMSVSAAARTKSAMKHAKTRVLLRRHSCCVNTIIVCSSRLMTACGR